MSTIETVEDAQYIQTLTKLVSASERNVMIMSKVADLLMRL